MLPDNLIFPNKLFSIFPLQTTNMIFTNKKKFAVTFFLAACVIISVAATKPSPPKNDEEFKNLQVLPKNISEDSLDKVMDGFKAALGVRCNFCHVRNDSKDQWDFASDEKNEKNIARQMMRMTMDINAKYFNFENSTRADTITVVKCQTCHRGEPHPEEFEINNNEGHDRPPGPPPGTPQDENKPGNH